jgi:hypothetical protein
MLRKRTVPRLHTTHTGLPLTEYLLPLSCPVSGVRANRLKKMPDIMTKKKSGLKKTRTARLQVILYEVISHHFSTINLTSGDEVQ